MKSILLFSAAVSVFTAFSATNEVEKSGTNDLVKVGDRYLPRSVVHNASRMASLVRSGGTVREAGSAKGMFVILNAQKAVLEKELHAACAVIDRDAHVQFAVKPGADVTVANVKGKITKAGGTVGLALVESDELPSLVTAPESGWSIVNVKALKTPSADAEVLAKRVRCEILRGFAFVVGGAYVSHGDFLMRDVKAPEDLDETRREGFGIEVSRHIDTYSHLYGITPWRQASYRKACREGWAPAPTNDYQKAIWNEIHALPSNPIKIKYDPKRDK